MKHSRLNAEFEIAGAKTRTWRCAVVLAVSLALIETARADTVKSDNDPFEPANRSIYNLNRNVIDQYFLKPLVKTYKRTVPRPTRASVRHVLLNMKEPLNAENDFLQGNLVRAGSSVGRLIVNSTIGALGLFDIGARIGLAPQHEDFGQTLGVYGFGEGPYFVLPVIGPQPLRDLFGRVVDHFLDPMSLLTYANQTYVDIGREGMTVVADRAHDVKSQMTGEEEKIKSYEDERVRYREKRELEILNLDEDEDSPPRFHVPGPPPLAAHPALASLPKSDVEPLGRLQARLTAQGLPISHVELQGGDLVIMLSPISGGASLACEETWKQLPIDALEGINTVRISRAAPSGPEQSCTKFLPASAQTAP